MGSVPLSTPEPSGALCSLGCLIALHGWGFGDNGMECLSEFAGLTKQHI